MGKKRSAARRNKKFKSVDPFGRGKSTKNLGAGKFWKQLNFIIRQIK